MGPVLVLCLLARGAGSPQDAEPDPGRAQMLERLAQLPESEQAALADRVYQAALHASHPLAAAAARLEADPALVPLPVLDPDPARAFAADEFAPNLGLKTRVVKPNEAAWKKVQRQYFGKDAGKSPGKGTAADPAAVWAYDTGRNALLRPAQPRTPAQRVADLYDGHWPDPGRLEALAEAALDQDAQMDAAADYFGHAYRDRQGHVYSGMPLFDLWECGKEIEISDVEAIAWLQTVAGEHGVTAPIANKQHQEIYQRISDSFQEVRQYRHLHQALAARYADPDGAMPPLYTGQEAFMDQVWALHDHDMHALQQLMGRFPERNAFLGELNRMVQSPPAGFQERLSARAGLAPALAAAARAQLKSEGLMGLGQR